MIPPVVASERGTAQTSGVARPLSYFEKWNTKVSSRDLFREAVQKFCDDNRLTAQEHKKDWREMTDEAAQKAALEADSDMRATAASAATLSAAANGLGTTSEADRL